VTLILPSACAETAPAPGSDHDALLQVAQATNDAAGAPQPRSAPAAGFGSYLAGRQALSEADNKAAADYFLKALKTDPTNVMLARHAYAFLIAEGDIENGMAIAQRALELDPDESWAAILLSIHDVQGGNYQAAVDRLKSVKEVGINAVFVPLFRAWALVGLERWDDALKALASLKKTPSLQALHDYHAGLILELAGRPDEARKVYAASLAQDSAPSVRAVQVVASFLYRHDHQTEALDLIDSVRRSQNHSPLVEALFAGAGNGEGLSAPVVTARDGMAEALFSAATLLSGANMQGEAMITARLSTALRPDFPFSTYMVASILEKQERYADMVDILKPVEKKNPAYYILRLRLAAAYDQLEQTDEALKVLRGLEKDYPDQIDPVIAQAGIEHHQKNWLAAAALYQRVLDQTPEPTANQWNIYYALGMCLERGKRWPEAEKALQTALTLMPDQPSVLNYLGYSWIDRGINLEEGKALIEKAVAQRPADGYILDSLGWVYYLTGDYERAVTELEKAIEYTPADPTINEHLGDAYWRVGRTSEAYFQWQRALTLDPEPDMIAPLKEKLEKGLPAAHPKGQN
jgi:tetratricopeptide (TPR) repeat protein